MLSVYLITEWRPRRERAISFLMLMRVVFFLIFIANLFRLVSVLEWEGLNSILSITEPLNHIYIYKIQRYATGEVVKELLCQHVITNT